MNTLRKQHYNFAFLTLPLLALSNTNETFKKLDRNDRLEYLKILWNGLGNKTNEHLPDRGLNCFKKNIGENIILYLIQLPKPEVPPEAFYIGLVFWIEKGFLSSKAIQAKCYTLELSKDIPTNREIFVVGEMVHGQSFPNFDHKNYGVINKNDAESFVRVMQEVLSGEKTSNLWHSAIPKENPKPSITSDSELLSRNKAAEAEFNRLLNKWKNYPVADHIKIF